MTTWSETALSSFKELFPNDKLSASTTKQCPCEKSSESMCTFLWERKDFEDDALSPACTQWVNINRDLFNQGLVHKTGDMLVEEFFEYTFNIPEKNQIVEDCKKLEMQFNANNNEHDENNSKVHLNGPIVAPAKVHQYIKPEKIHKTVFTGYPTYVDHEAVIYLHDDEGKKVIEQINNNIDYFLRSPEWTKHELNVCHDSFSNSEDWEHGQACLARFHFDSKYYRAEIVSFLESDCIQVRFIDYGNVEECRYTDLLNIIVYPLVPIQARKYKLYGIKPLNNESRHGTNVLDVMHKLVVEKICQIRVETKVSISF